VNWVENLLTRVYLALEVGVLDDYGVPGGQWTELGREFAD